jgi:hypothetical protein
MSSAAHYFFDGKQYFYLLRIGAELPTPKIQINRFFIYNLLLLIVD